MSSTAEANATFPNTVPMAHHVEPPSPSRENPGQVYPLSEPQSAPKGAVPSGVAQADNRKGVAKVAGMAFESDGVPAEKGGLFKD